MAPSPSGEPELAQPPDVKMEEDPPPAAAAPAEDDGGQERGANADLLMADAIESIAEAEGRFRGAEEQTFQERKPTEPDETKPDTKLLEDLFDDIDSDDEFPPAAQPGLPGEPKQSSPPRVSPPLSQDDEDDDHMQLKASDMEVLRSFYQRFFPWRYYFQWLNHSPIPGNDFNHREFAFTLPGPGGGIYARYKSYATADLFRRDVLRLMPTRWEIGPVYSASPRDRKQLAGTRAFRAVSKELCFDIDLTDYDDVRTCCSGAGICRRCWRFAALAMRVVDASLREDFGFEHILWVYSGRRGVHAWVCDAAARALDNRRREAITAYLEVVRGGAQSGKKVQLDRPLHPHVERSLDILKAHFQADILEAQDPWATPEGAEKLLRLLPDRKLVEALRARWAEEEGRSSMEKWGDIEAVFQAGGGGGGGGPGLSAEALLEAKEDILLEYTYPRLDAEVSRKLIHLLKSPFVVHPGTGNVCVPIDFGRLDAFDPMAVPTVQGLLREIDGAAAGKKGGGAAEEEDGGGGPEAGAGRGQGRGEDRTKPAHEWEKTSLGPYMEYFRLFVAHLLRVEQAAKMKKEEGAAGSMEF